MIIHIHLFYRLQKQQQPTTAGRFDVPVRLSCHHTLPSEYSTLYRAMMRGHETSANCCVANGALSECCRGTQVLGRVCDMALRRRVERGLHQTVQGGLPEKHAVETSSSRQTDLLGMTFHAILGRRLDTETEGLQHVD